MVMSERSSVEFSDFHKFVILLRDQPGIVSHKLHNSTTPHVVQFKIYTSAAYNMTVHSIQIYILDITTAHLRTLAKTAVRSKLPPSSKKETAKVLLDMFVQLFVAEGDIAEASELLTQYISHPVMCQEPSLNAALAILSCLEVIRFVHKTKKSVLLLSTANVNENVVKTAPSDSDSDRSSDSGSDSDFESGGVERNDIPELDPSHAASALLCPSCGDIVENPFQFFSSVNMIQQFSKIRTSKYIK
jgi:hypothetical protein